MVEFGATLARMRRNAGKSTMTLARALNADPVYIERLERGDGRPPDRQFVLDVARALELNETQTDELLWSANHLPQRVSTPNTNESRTVALFVDHENVYIALNELIKNLSPEMQAQERRKIDPAALALTMRSAAEQIGWIKVALAVADWERLPSGQVKEYLKLRYQVDYNLPGRNNADLKLADAIRNVLEDDAEDEIDSYILVTGDGGYLTILDTLLRRQKHVHVWGVRGTVNAVLQQNASECAWIEDLLGIPEARPDNRGPITVESSRPASIGNDVTRLEALAIHLSRYLRQRSWSFITFVRFLNFLAETGVFGTSREEQLAWLSHAKETGVIQEDIVDDPADPTRIARRFSLNEEHPVVVRAQSIRQRVGEIVPSNGRGLAFGVVIDRLISEPDLQLTDVQAKNWLTWFAETGYLLAEQVPHFRKEGVTVTLVRLNPANWENAPTEGEDERIETAADAAVVRLANFLERHPHFAWMALSQLLNHMSDGALNGPPAASPNRQRAKQAVATAQESGLILVEQIPNLKTGGATTVARLNRESARVTELLTLRDTLIRRLAEMLVSRSGISRPTFQVNLVERLGLNYDDAGAWIELLIGEGLIIQDLDHDGTPGALRVDHQDLIVSRILYGSLQGTPEVQRL